MSKNIQIEEILILRTTSTIISIGGNIQMPQTVVVISYSERN